MQTKLRWAGHVVRMPDHRSASVETSLLRTSLWPTLQRRPQETCQRDIERLTKTLQHQSHPMGTRGYGEAAVVEQRRKDRKDGAPRCPKAATMPCP